MLSKAISKKFFYSALSRASFSTADGNISTPIAQRPGIGKEKNVTVIPGIGIGPEVTGAVQRIFKAAVCPIKFETLNDFSIDNIDKPEMNATLRKNETILLGSISKRSGEKYKDTTRIYKELGLFANLTYAKSLPNVNTRHQNVDICVLRENTEGEYSGVEHEVYPGVVESLKIVTKTASDKIANYAFEFAYVSGRKKVTAVHKANIMKLCDGLFLESCREVAEKYPFIQYEEMIIDNTCMQLVKNPWRFDVMVMPNLYGTIVSNTVAGICGGPGMTCGANIGDKYTIFEQGTRHSGIDIAGKNVANPTALILSSIMMLKHLGLPKFATDIERALDKTYRDGKVRTQDIGGNNSLDQFVDAVIGNLQKS
jgi:isocitrate dehydrogenase (NAD+)